MIHSSSFQKIVIKLLIFRFLPTYQVLVALGGKLNKDQGFPFFFVLGQPFLLSPGKMVKIHVF